MPFSGTSSCSAPRWTEIYEEVFVPAIEGCGYTCDRASVTTGSLIKSIIERLRIAYVVLADMTDSNPNVFYELGVRHSLSKRTIMVAQNAKHIPSDLRGYWSVVYGTSPKKVSQFKADIRRILEEIDNDPGRSDNPVLDYLDREFVQLSRQTQSENLKRLTALFTELTGNAIAVSRIQAGDDSTVLLSYDCLSYLLQTMYVDVGPAILKDMYELRNLLRSMERKGLSEEEHAVARTGLCRVLQAVSHIRQKLACGQYQEPETITVMQWSSCASPEVRTSCEYWTASLAKEWTSVSADSVGCFNCGLFSRTPTALAVDGDDASRDRPRTG